MPQPQCVCSLCSLANMTSSRFGLQQAPTVPALALSGHRTEFAFLATASALAKEQAVPHSLQPLQSCNGGFRLFLAQV